MTQKKLEVSLFETVELAVFSYALVLPIEINNNYFLSRNINTAATPLMMHYK